ncbi:MAG: flagellar basal body P-ring formation chaperone FlgA [Pseudomonadota bacterium]
MHRLAVAGICLVLATTAVADLVVPTRTIRPGHIIKAGDVQVVEGSNAGSFDRLNDVVGQEARLALYPSRPIPFEAIGAPAVITRNQIVPLLYAGRGIFITTDARALQRGGIGDRIRLMNLSSRTVVYGFVRPDGSIIVK